MSNWSTKLAKGEVGLELCGFEVVLWETARQDLVKTEDLRVRLLWIVCVRWIEPERRGLGAVLKVRHSRQRHVKDGKVLQLLAQDLCGDVKVLVRCKREDAVLDVWTR